MVVYKIRGCIVSTGLLFKNCKPLRKHVTLNIVSKQNGEKIVRDAKAMADAIVGKLFGSPAYAKALVV